MTAIEYIDRIQNQLRKQHLAGQWQDFLFCPRPGSVVLINFDQGY